MHLAAIHGENVSEYIYIYIYLIEKEFPAETDQECHVRTRLHYYKYTGGARDYIGLSDIFEKTHIVRTFELHSSVVSITLLANTNLFSHHVTKNSCGQFPNVAGRRDGEFCGGERV
jgi:hypothetical protein